MKKVLFLDTTHEILKEELKKAGFVCEDFKDIDYEKCLSIIENYYGIIVRSKFIIDKNFLLKAKNLRFIGRVGSGMENIDIKTAEQLKISCYNSPEGNRDAVGEHSLGLLLCLFNKINIADFEVKNGLWQREKNRGIEIKGKTVGIIGYGNMGSAFAQRLKGFECNILAYDKYKRNFGNDYVKEVSLNEIFEYADILSLHVPLTSETEYMFDTEFINRFKKYFYLINTSRGKVVKTIDLLDALKSGKILGAALDVIEYEDHSFENVSSMFKNNVFLELSKMPNVIFTPHVAGWTIESKYKLAKILAEKIIKDHASNIH